jgi:hypothetical protein
MTSRGWVLKREGQRFFAVNTSLKLGTIILDTAQAAIDDAARMQDQYDEKEKEKAAPKKPAIEELLNGRMMAVSFVWMPGVTGKVWVSVNLSLKPEDASKQLLDASSVRGFSEPVMQLIFEQLKKAKAPKKSAAKPSATKTGLGPKAQKRVDAVKREREGEKARAKKSGAKKAVKASASKSSSKKARARA